MEGVFFSIIGYLIFFIIGSYIIGGYKKEDGKIIWTKFFLANVIGIAILVVITFITMLLSV